MPRKNLYKFDKVKQADLSRCKRIYLLHLSDKNSNAYEIKQQVQELTGCEVRIYRDWETDRKSTRLNSSHSAKSRMPSSA